jgi:hypothetical protein
MDPAWTSRCVLATRLAARSCRGVGVETTHVGAVCVISSRVWFQLLRWNGENCIASGGNPAQQVLCSALAASDLLFCSVVGVHSSHAPSNG